jgi:hypothetical protein
MEEIFDVLRAELVEMKVKLEETINEQRERLCLETNSMFNQLRIFIEIMVRKVGLRESNLLGIVDNCKENLDKCAKTLDILVKQSNIMASHVAMLNASNSQIQKLVDDVKSLKMDNARILGLIHIQNDMQKELVKSVDNVKVMVTRAKERERKSSSQKVLDVKGNGNGKKKKIAVAMTRT